MDRQGSGGNKEKTNPFKKSETWVPCENDEIVTYEKLKILLEAEDEHHHQSYLRAFLRSQCHDKDTCNDICQEVWAIMLAKVKEEIIYRSGLRRYAGKVAYGLVLNERRRRAKYKPDSNFEILVNNEPNGETEGYSFHERRTASPEIIIRLKEAHNFLEHFLEPREQKIFFYDQWGYNDTEIAEKLGIQKNNVRQIRYRASRRLAQYINQRKLYEDTVGR